MSNLDQLATEINARLDRRTADHRLAAGLLLRQAKGQVPHGQWGAWTADNINRSRGEVIRLLALAPAKNLPAVIPKATIRAATMIQEAAISAATITATAKIEAERIIMTAKIKAGEIKQEAADNDRFLAGLTKALREAKVGERFICRVSSDATPINKYLEAVHRGGGVL